MTPLHIACCELHWTYADILLHYGANIAAQNNEGQTPLIATLWENTKYLYTYEKNKDMLKLIKFLCSRMNVNEINTQDKWGWTALTYAQTYYYNVMFAPGIIAGYSKENREVRDLLVQFGAHDLSSYCSIQ